MTRWTDDQLAAVRARYTDEPTARIATDLGRTASQVYQKAAALGLKKSPEYLAGTCACRLAGDVAGKPFRFQKGFTPWNKGIAFESGGRSHEARFKPGNVPHHTLPIGSYRTTKDGTLQRKISDAKGGSYKRWRGVHELVWTEANGPVPRGHIVVFKQAQRTTEPADITLDRVECISFAENMRRNTVHNLPKEVAELCQLRGALNRQINKRSQA